MHRSLRSLNRWWGMAACGFAGGDPCCCQGGGGSSGQRGSSGSSRRVVGSYFGSGGDQGCVYCTGFKGPYEWRVDIDGVTNNICRHCDNWNATYYLTPSPNNRCFAVTDNTACCCWTSPNGGDACEENIPPNLAGEFAICTLQVCATYDGFPAGIRVRMFHARTGGFLLFQKLLATPINCRAIAGMDIPGLTTVPSYCTPSLATCQITALP